MNGRTRRGLLASAVTAAAVVAIASPAFAADGAEPTGQHGRWGQVPFEAGLRDEIGGSSISAVAAGTTTVVAVGAAPTGAAAWTSLDGLSWRRAIAPASWSYGACKGLWPILYDVVATQDGFVAVGSSCVPGSRRDIEGVVWTSTDGRTWKRAARGVDRVLWSVTEHAGRLYASGVAAIWASDDGRDWEPVFESDTSLSLGVISSIGPVLFAGGSGWTREEGHRAVILVSSDGADWSHAEIDADSFGSIADVAAVADGYVAVGQADISAAAWTSSDGRRWSPVAMSDLPVGAIPGHASDLVALTTLPHGEAIAVLNDDVGRARILRSMDGSIWDVDLTTPVANSDDGYYRATDAVALPVRTLVVGSYEDGPRGASAAVWTNPPPAAVAARGGWSDACPGGPVTLLVLLEMSPEGRVECYGDRVLSFRAFVARHSSGFREFASPPYWLTLGEGGALALPAESHPATTMSLLLHRLSSPGHRVRWPYGEWAIVRGHFDHRAARECSEQRQACRAAFVVTDVRRDSRVRRQLRP